MAQGSTLFEAPNFARRACCRVRSRVVHGGVRYDSPVQVTSNVLDDLARLAPLAPLHQPHNLHGLSYEFLVARFGELAPTLANARIVIAHLGHGASMWANRSPWRRCTSSLPPDERLH
jgi:acetate kinase